MAELKEEILRTPTLDKDWRVWLPTADANWNGGAANFSLNGQRWSGGEIDYYLDNLECCSGACLSCFYPD